MEKSHDIRLISGFPINQKSFKNLEGLNFYDLAGVFNLESFAVKGLRLLPVRLAFLRYAKGFEILPHAHAEPQIKFVINPNGRLNIHDSGVITNEHIALTRAGRRYSATVETDTDLIVATLIEPS